MHKVYLSIGGNLGNRPTNLKRSLLLINQKIGSSIMVSPIYETKAWGIENQPDFLNLAVLIHTKLSPELVLKNILTIEKKMGRIRERKWFSRIIDIDILFYDDLILETESLTIPHPYIAKRNFVLAPLSDIAPEFIHPVFQQTIKELYASCNDPLDVFVVN